MEHELRLQPCRATTNRILRYPPKGSGSVADGGRPRPIAVRDFGSQDYIPRLHPRLMEVTQISASIYELKAIGPRDANPCLKKLQEAHGACDLPHSFYTWHLSGKCHWCIDEGRRHDFASTQIFPGTLYDLHVMYVLKPGPMTADTSIR